MLKHFVLHKSTTQQQLMQLLGMYVIILFSLICYSFIPSEIKVAYERVSLNGPRKGQVFIGIFFREQDFPI